jgi:N-methylhydantoinase B
MDPARLEVFKHLFASVAEEMGGVLRRTGFSPNIKERRDFSCALFDSHTRLVAQAAHIPVHLGAMPLSVAACAEALELEPGDVAALNDPFHGGTHLPDITLVTPIFAADARMGFAASRAHHADVGGAQPGSMSPASELYQEGIVIPPVRLVRGGSPNRGVWDMLLANVRTPDERAGDLRAQLAANRKGVERVGELVEKYGRPRIEEAQAALLAYAESMMRELIGELPDGVYRFSDRMDDDGVTDEPVEIRVAVTVRGDEVVVDFTGTSEQRPGAINAVEAITLSAVYYVFRCLVGLDIPSNSGCLAPIRVVAPRGTVVNARRPAAVAAGNVETSQRIVDVLLGALADAVPDRVPAASQGTMNNLTIGGWDPERRRPFAYYETIAGGTGGRPDRPGCSAVHTHMTNTLNTPVEALEYAYPLRVRRYEIRRGSGGSGRYPGGDGIRRDVELLAPARAAILSDRRRFPPYGLADGQPGGVGRNVLIGTGQERELPGKTSLDVRPGDVISIRTPGGGGHGG